MHQDGAEVLTKFGKTFTTYFMPVAQMYEDCLAEWIDELTKFHLFGPSDPLFPKPDINISPSAGIVNRGLSRLNYKTNDCLRRVIKQAFKAVGLPPYTPHRFRNIAVATSNGYVTTQRQQVRIRTSPARQGSTTRDQPSLPMADLAGRAARPRSRSALVANSRSSRSSRKPIFWKSSIVWPMGRNG